MTGRLLELTRLASASIVVLTSPQIAISQGVEQGILLGHDLELVEINKQTEFSVVIDDSVSDGCWLNASRVKSTVERELLDAGYSQIVDERVWGVEVFISGLGYGISSNQCAVYLSLSLSVVDADRRLGEGVDWIAIEYAEAMRFGVLLTGPKAPMSGRILDSVEGFVDEMLVTIQQEKNSLRDAVEQSDNSESAKEFIYSIAE